MDGRAYDPETGLKDGGDVVQVLRQDSQDINKIKIVNIGTQVVLSENNTCLDFDNSYEIAEGDKIHSPGQRISG